MNKLNEWSKKGLDVAIRVTYIKGYTKYYACISRKGFNNKIVNDNDLKDTWLEAYNDAIKKVEQKTY